MTEIAISANFGVSLSVHRYSARLYCTGEEEDENIIAVIWSLNKCYNLKFGQEYHIFVGHCCKRPDVNAALFPISYRYQSIYPTHMHSPNINRTRNIRLALTRLRPHVVHTTVQYWYYRQPVYFNSFASFRRRRPTIYRPFFAYRFVAFADNLCYYSTFF